MNVLEYTLSVYKQNRTCIIVAEIIFNDISNTDIHISCRQQFFYKLESRFLSFYWFINDDRTINIKEMVYPQNNLLKSVNKINDERGNECIKKLTMEIFTITRYHM